MDTQEKETLKKKNHPVSQWKILQIETKSWSHRDMSQVIVETWHIRAEGNGTFTLRITLKI